MYHSLGDVTAHLAAPRSHIGDEMEEKRRQQKSYISRSSILANRIHLDNNINRVNLTDRYTRIRDDLEIIEQLLHRFHVDDALAIAKSLVRDLTIISDSIHKNDP